MVGGFLGSGKTTAVAKIARRLSDHGSSVGLITNDQGTNLVDTAMLRAHGFATEEIAGGCFCCRFNSLVEASRLLTESAKPDVFIAEPVGSCTDLVATVTYPLRRIYGGNFLIAPLSVLVDPIRARRIFGLEEGRVFSERVLYIYRKQLEEADIIVISKSDLLDCSRIEELKNVLAGRYPLAQVISLSVRSGANFDCWLEQITSGEQSPRSVMQVDYDIYAEGEALLGWLNCTVGLSSRLGFDADAFLSFLARELQQRLAQSDAEIAHLKMTLSPEGGIGEIAVVNLVRNDFVPELSLQLEEPVEKAQLIINLRAEAPPGTLDTVLRAALPAAAGHFPALEFTLDHLEHFRPGRPNPTHRQP
jgi:Ni2+-binding GTPase involved in maturation of urease and hydrogenase